MIVANSRWDPFSDLSADQLRLFERYEGLLKEMNERVNLISRATADDLRVRHLEHSLTLSMRDFPSGSSVVDWGTGGGLPGIPLAIRFPDVTFHLVDSVAKKVRAIGSIVGDLALGNVIVHRMRAEDWTTPIDYAVSRATASLCELWGWTEPVLAKERAVSDREWPQGLIALKGGDLTDEIARVSRLRTGAVCEQISLVDQTGRREFKDKYVVCVRRAS